MKIVYGVLSLVLICFSFLMLNRVRANYRVRFDDFLTASLIEPWEWSHQFKLGGQLLNRSQPGQAIPYLRRANAMMPYHWGPVNNLAVAYGMLGDIAQADKLMNELVRLFPGNPVIKQNRLIIDRLTKEKNHETGSEIRSERTSLH